MRFQKKKSSDSSETESIKNFKNKLPLEKTSKDSVIAPITHKDPLRPKNEQLWFSKGEVKVYCIQNKGGSKENMGKRHATKQKKRLEIRRVIFLVELDNL